MLPSEQPFGAFVRLHCLPFPSLILLIRLILVIRRALFAGAFLNLLSGLVQPYVRPSTSHATTDKLIATVNALTIPSPFLLHQILLFFADLLVVYPFFVYFHLLIEITSQNPISKLNFPFSFFLSRFQFRFRLQHNKLCVRYRFAVCLLWPLISHRTIYKFIE